MAWKLLPTNYTDAVWDGMKKYNQITNSDGTVSFQDVTIYSHKENSFFGALDANRMNEALNTIMSMMENGTGLYGSVSSVAGVMPDPDGNVDLTASDIDALPKSGGTMTGTLTTKGIVLTQGVDYGDSLPSTVTAGKLFFKRVT